MLCGLIKPDQGRIQLNGEDLLASRRRALAGVSAVLEGNRNIYWRLTTRENLEFFSALHGASPKATRPMINHYLELFNLGSKAHVEARQLSRGMQQKLAIAVSLISGSQILLLDEPTLGLDVQASYEIRQLLKTVVAQEGRTIVLTTHDMNVVQDTCERVIIINDGRIITDDSIKNLMELFKVRVYRVVVQGKLAAQQYKDLKGLPNLVIESPTPEQTILTLRLEDPNMFYALMAVLASNNSIIESIDQEQNNFERIFLGLVEGGVQSA